MLRTLAVMAVLLTPGYAVAQEEFNVLTGTVAGFECGDNCYLTVTFGEAGQLVGLCVAPECANWNEQVAIPEGLVGAAVRVEVGVGEQYQGDELTAPYIAFTSVTVLP